MTRFSRLFAAIDGTTATTAKVTAMAGYFASAPPADAAWAVYFLTGRRLKRLVSSRAVGQWALAATGLDDWLLTECYAVVGDGAETATLILDQVPSSPAPPCSLTEWVEQRIVPLRGVDPQLQQERVLGWIRELDRWERFTLLKLLTGEFRVGVSQTLVARALADAAALPVATMAARLMGQWTPNADWFAALVSSAATAVDQSRPYPFCLAAPLDPPQAPSGAWQDALGDPGAWQLEWKWDGIRAQLVKRTGMIALWSRGEDLITERFPEVIEAAAALADGTVLDGEVLAYRDGRPLPFAALQQRIGRRTQVARTARDVPVVFMAYDLLEHDGVDIRDQPLGQRRSRLEAAIAVAHEQPRVGPVPPPTRSPLLPFMEDSAAPPSEPGWALTLSPRLDAATWEAAAELRASARARGVEGLMIKRLASPYGVGRRRGDWWKAKIDPHTLDAVLIYAQPGSGKRASLLTDYTFGVWDGAELVPVAKAYSGLTNEEIAEMDRWIRRHTVARFGPVRHVEPFHVMELGFEAIARSTRHRSGIAVRFPRMLRWRRDKTAAQADTIETLRRLHDLS